MSVRWAFRKETLEKMNRELTSRERMDLRIQRLKEAEENGTLQKIRDRKELGKLLGFDTDTEEGKHKASCCITGLIQERKALQEIMIEGTNRWNAKYEYHYRKPVARKRSGRVARMKKPAIEEEPQKLWKDGYKPETVEPEPLNIINEQELDKLIKSLPSDRPQVNVTIEVKGLAIKMVSPSAEYIAEIVNALTKGD